MKKHIGFKKILFHNGFDYDAIGRCTIVSYDGTWLYLIDAEGDYVRCSVETTTPIIVDSNTTSITVSPTGVTLKNNGQSQTFIVYNQNNDNVTFESTFVTDNTLVTTGGTYGAVITANSTPGNTGSTTVSITHELGYTGACYITIDATTTSLTGTSEFIVGSMDAFNHKRYDVYVYNQDGTNVTSLCTVASYDTVAATIETGLTSILVTAHTGQTSGGTFSGSAGHTGTTINLHHGDLNTGTNLSIPFAIYPLDNYEITSIHAYWSGTTATGITSQSGVTRQLYLYDQLEVKLNDYLDESTGPFWSQGAGDPWTGATSGHTMSSTGSVVLEAGLPPGIYTYYAYVEDGQTRYYPDTIIARASIEIV
jgi:hypothetical protein